MPMSETQPSEQAQAIEQAQAARQTQPQESHYVYVARCANGSLYTGYTVNVERRIATHNAGKGGRYTRAHRPVELMKYWCFPTKREALQVEFRIKQLSRQQKLAIASEDEVLEGMCPVSLSF